MSHSIPRPAISAKNNSAKNRVEKSEKKRKKQNETKVCKQKRKATRTTKHTPKRGAKARYKVTNWKEYNAALVKRGSL